MKTFTNKPEQNAAPVLIGYDLASGPDMTAEWTVKAAPDAGDTYLYGSCTESECRLCRTPTYARKDGMRHAGISMSNVPPAPDAGDLRKCGSKCLLPGTCEKDGCEREAIGIAAITKQSECLPNLDAGDFLQILKGIDKDEVEDDDGWWETSYQSEFGAQKLKEVLAVFNSNFLQIKALVENNQEQAAIIAAKQREKDALLIAELKSAINGLYEQMDSLEDYKFSRDLPPSEAQMLWDDARWSARKALLKIEKYAAIRGQE